MAHVVVHGHQDDRGQGAARVKEDLREHDQPRRGPVVAQSDPRERPPLGQQHEPHGATQAQQDQHHLALMSRARRVVHGGVQSFGVVRDREDDRRHERHGRVDLVEQTHEVRRAHRHLGDADEVVAARHQGGEEHLRQGEHHGHRPNERKRSVDPRGAVEGLRRGGARQQRVLGFGGRDQDESFRDHARVLEPVRGAAREAPQGPGLSVVGDGAHGRAQQQDGQIRGGQRGEEGFHLRAPAAPEVADEDQQHQQVAHRAGHADPDQEDGHGGPGVLSPEELDSSDEIEKGDISRPINIHLLLVRVSRKSYPRPQS